MNLLVVFILTVGCCYASSIRNSFSGFINHIFAPLRGIERIRRLPDIPIVPLREVVYSKKKPTSKVYDFVVIGMSPGGCIVTNRLTEDPSTTVLALEAGWEDNVLTDVPLLNPLTVLSDYSWNFRTEYTGDTCIGMTGGICPWPSGKGPGGGTILNALIYTRGNFRDFDSWANEGNPGWSYSDVLPYFNKVENMKIPELRNSSYHGTDGYLPISYVPFLTPLFNAFISAGKYYGFDRVDYNNPNSHIGFSQIQSTSFLGERFTAAKAYLAPIRERKNFEASLRSRVTKILIDPTTRRAYGATYVKEGKERVVYARKEVILAAGAFNSPQLLMLSGIGPAYHLQDVGIPVLQDLPVGDNLMEHVGMHGLSFLIKKKISISLLRTISDVIPTSVQYLAKSKGILTSLGCEGVAYMKTKYSNSTEDYPDVELLFVPTSLNTDAGVAVRKTFGIDDDLYEYTYRGVDGKDAFTIWPMLMYPQSRGYVRLKDKNPLNKVRIVHGFYTSPIDLKIMIEAIKYAVLLGESPPFRKFGTRLLEVPFPQCAQLQFRTDEYWECAARVMTTQWHHQSGTCKMGTVVDNRLNVIGINGLRVVDASIMPTITGGHTQAPAYMIGEKAADLIKEDWRMI